MVRAIHPVKILSALGGLFGLVAACSCNSPTAPGTSGTGGSIGTSDQVLCVNAINAFRATISLAPLTRWSSGESCASTQAAADAASGIAHSAFGSCAESAQNECTGWPSPASTALTGCLQQMWNEGPGTDFATHGHYINMTNTTYTQVACGFATASNGRIWITQDFK